MLRNKTIFPALPFPLPFGLFHQHPPISLGNCNDHFLQWRTSQPWKGGSDMGQPATGGEPSMEKTSQITGKKDMAVWPQEGHSPHACTHKRERAADRELPGLLHVLGDRPGYTHLAVPSGSIPDTFSQAWVCKAGSDCGQGPVASRWWATGSTVVSKYSQLEMCNDPNPTGTYSPGNVWTISAHGHHNNTFVLAKFTINCCA